jgi:enamine deaminase RidA (YjgF/YER057c/UK114 family)
MSDRTIVLAADAPRSVGSGSLPIDPETQQLVGGSLAEETRQCLDNLVEIDAIVAVH